MSQVYSSTPSSVGSEASDPSRTELTRSRSRQAQHGGRVSHLSFHLSQTRLLFLSCFFSKKEMWVALHAAVIRREHTSGETGKADKRVGEGDGALPETPLETDVTSESERASAA